MFITRVYHQNAVGVRALADIVLPQSAKQQVETFFCQFRDRGGNIAEDGAMTGCVFFIRSFTHFARCVPYCCYRLHNLADAQALPCFAAYLIPASPAVINDRDEPGTVARAAAPPISSKNQRFRTWNAEQKEQLGVPAEPELAHPGLQQVVEQPHQAISPCKLLQPYLLFLFAANTRHTGNTS